MEQFPTEPRLRVLLVASPLVCRVAQQMLRNAAEIEVCGTVRAGREALALLPSLRPQVICVSDELVGMSALELTREIMSRHACPILIMQSLCGLEPSAAARESVFALLQAGAVDVFSMSSIVPGPDSPQTRQLIAKIKMVARVPVISRLQRSIPAPETSDSTAALTVARLSPRTLSLSGSTGRAVPASPSVSASVVGTRVVAIGASTGGPQALLAVLSELPRDYALPVLCVQHISKGFIGGLIEWLDGQCALKVRIARAGEIPTPGTVYFPEEDKHLELDESDGTIRLSLSPAVDGHRPSATTLFQSVARRSRSRGIAVLLTGMGCDGAKGLQAVHEAQGITIAQNQESCVVFGMPAAAIQLGAAQQVLPLGAIGKKLVALGK